MAEWTEKLIAGKVKVPVKLNSENGRIYFTFRYNPALMAEVKVMAGSKYHGYDQENPRKVWSVTDCPRNRFQLDYLAGRNPYAWWDRPLIDFKSNRSECRAHQRLMTAAGLTYHYCIWGAEMGVGKTLSAIELMEQSNRLDWIWVAPRSAINAAQLEFKRWQSKVKPITMTYDYLVKVMEGWKSGTMPPHGVVFDESSRCKNHTTQRSQACQHLADAIRAEWGFEHGYVVEMSGSPAPKSPADWWSQCEIAAPGYIREGRIDKFRDRLALIRQEESFVGGGKFPKLVTWWDDERKCRHCGKFEEELWHDVEKALMTNQDYHPWEASVNEVSYLYERMKGLVHVFFKKDCLDLPEKQYRMIFCPATQQTLNAMKAIVATSESTIKAMTLCRELSDGFQYKNIPIGREVCDLCFGARTVKFQSYVGPDFSDEELERVGVSAPWQHPEVQLHPEWWQEQEGACQHCGGTGEVTTYQREAIQVPTPKEQALVDLLEEHEDVGRIVVYAGFTGSIERVRSICGKAGWNVVVVDGRGWHTDMWMPTDTGGSRPPTGTELLEIFQDPKGSGWDKVAFVAQPASGGLGVTLTASPTIVYWSNDFNAESRIQSEDRIHRLGMDTNRGATIVDLVHLPTDKLVLDNLKVKRDLQGMSMGQLKVALDRAVERRV